MKVCEGRDALHSIAGNSKDRKPSLHRQMQWMKCPKGRQGLKWAEWENGLQGRRYEDREVLTPFAII